MPRAPRILHPGPAVRARRRHAAVAATGLDPLKLRALDVASSRLGARTFADLGAVWAVAAGYSFHLAQLAPTQSVTIVDDDIPADVRERAAGVPGMRTVEGNFGDPALATSIGPVDAVVMFDVLLHQVAPDWDEVLALYASRTDCLVLAGPWYQAAQSSVRLLDLGEAEYLASVPEQDIHEGLFARLDEIHPRRQRPWRDVHDIWQWGITDADLRACAQRLGFVLAHFEDLGPWRGLPRFHDCAYVFARPERLTAAT